MDHASPPELGLMCSLAEVSYHRGQKVRTRSVMAHALARTQCLAETGRC